MANLPFNPSPPQMPPPGPPKPAHVFHKSIMRYAIAVGEAVKGFVVLLFWLIVAAAAISATYLALRAIWSILNNVLRALGV